MFCWVVKYAPRELFKEKLVNSSPGGQTCKRVSPVPSTACVRHNIIGGRFVPPLVPSHIILDTRSGVEKGGGNGRRRNPTRHTYIPPLLSFEMSST